MKTISFGTLKGGVGKTMLCFNIAGILSQSGYRVLIVDSDLQGNLTNNVGIDRTFSGLTTLYDIYNISAAPPSPEGLIYEQPNSRLPNLDLVPSSIFLHRAELALSGISGRELVLRSYFDDHAEYLSRYDYILLDTNPSMSVVNQNAFVVSDAILLVSDVSMNSLEGSQLFIALWEEARRRLRIQDNIKGFIVNNFDMRTRLSSDFMEYIRTSDDVSDLRALMTRSMIPRNVRITESELAAVPINLYDTRSKGYAAISSLVDELFKKGIL